jgi:hypothetical protein
MGKKLFLNERKKNESKIILKMMKKNDFSV